MSTSTERAVRYKERQRAAGRKPVVMWLQPDTIAKLRKLSKGRARGEIVERAVSDLSRVSNSARNVIENG